MTRRAKPGSLILFALLTPSHAWADPFVVNTTITTSGWFECRSTIPCTGEGTNRVTLISGDATATLTFTGVNSAFEATTTAAPVTLGAFELVAPDNFLFPTHPANPQLPMLSFVLTAGQGTPVPGTLTRTWGFGPGGLPVLTLQQAPASSIQFPVGDNPYRYMWIVYSLDPFPFTITPNQTTPMLANVGVVPEPATMVLLGSGLIGLAAAHRRRRAVRQQQPG